MSLSNLISSVRHRGHNDSSQDLDIECEQNLVKELCLESEFATFEGFRLFALKFLEAIDDRPGDTEDIRLISEIINKYEINFEKRWSGAKKSTLFVKAETDVGLLRCLEQTTNFMTRLRNRRYLSEIDEKKLMLISRILHYSLRDQVRNQPRYSYSPLQYHPEARVAKIRVLHLLSSRGDPLQCRIEHVYVASIPFIALSYEWGDSDKLFWIEVIDADKRSLGTISLTANLYNALCNLRDSSTVMIRSFWIDQISINQGDDTERGHQVDMMGKIYTAAARVISYLGPGEASDGDGFKLLERIHKQFEHLYEGPMLHDDLNSTRELYRFQDQIPEEIRFKNDAPDSAWRSLKELVYGLWTRRLWMVQETCLNAAEDGVTLMRGDRSFPFAMAVGVEILRYIGLLPSWGKWVENCPNQMAVVLQCWEVRGGLTGRNGRSWTDLASLLSFFANTTECLDPRDRVFGLLGLARDVQELGIVADYNKSYEDVLHDVSIRIMSQQSDMGLLQPLNEWDTENINSALSLPSWVSRWPSRGVMHSILHGYNAATQWTGPVSFLADYLRLQLLGIRVACVLQITSGLDQWLTGRFTFPDLYRLESMLVTAKGHLNKHQPNPGTVVIITILGRTEWPHSKESIDQAFESLLKLVAIAKIKLNDQFGEEGVELLSVINDLPQDEQQLTKAIILHGRLQGRVVCLTDGHKICLVPRHTQAGDVIVVFRGGPNLYVIRLCGKYYQYIGDAYMYGLMKGEVMEKDGWERRVEEFSLV